MRIYTTAFLSSTADGMVSPFVFVYAVRLGASSSDIGWMRSFNNLFTYTLQVPWGRLSDRLRKRAAIVAVSSLASSLILMLIIFTTEPKMLIPIISLRSFIASASAPAWSALIGELTQASLRGTIISMVNVASSLGSLIATAIAGPLIDYSGGKLTVTIFVSSALSSMAAVILIGFREPQVGKSIKMTELASLLRTSDLLKTIGGNTDFELFLKLSAAQGFFLTFAWPLFPITMVEMLNLSMSEIGAISIIGIIITLLSQPLMGKAVDRFGRRPILIFNFVSLTAVPLMYCYASDFVQLAIYNIFPGIITAAGNASVLTYLLDIIPEDRVGEFTAIYNMVIGISYFAGSVAGGNLTQFAIMMLGKESGLEVGYLISASGRFVTGISFMKVKERFSSSIRQPKS
ncbi:MAG: MFS transporter [Thermoproteota archaeon]